MNPEPTLAAKDGQTVFSAETEARRFSLLQYVPQTLSLLGLFALLASPALAQETNPRTDAPIHIGPVYITPVLQVTRLGVDTNVFNTRGERQSDFTFTTGPQIDIAVPLRRFVFVAETATDFVYYQRFENQRGINFGMALRGEVQIQRFSFFVEDSFLKTRERPNFEIDVRARRKENDARAGLSFGIFRKLEVELAASQSIRKYNGDDLVGARLARFLNRDVVTASASVRYAITPMTVISVAGELRGDRFDFTSTRDNDSWSIVPGVEFNPRAIVSGSAEVGYRSLGGVNDSLPDFRGPVASVDLSHRLLGSSTIGFTASRDVQFSLEVVEPYYVATGYGVSFRHQFTAPFGISVGTQRFNYAYKQFGSGVSREAFASRVDTARSYSVTLDRRLTRTTEIGFNLAYSSRRSNSRELRDYDGLTAGMTTAYAF